VFVFGNGYNIVLATKRAAAASSAALEDAAPASAAQEDAAPASRRSASAI
jgi:hypothetical protein